MSSGNPSGVGSGVGVLDRSVAILEAVEAGARSLGDLTRATGLTRATAHRLASALQAHGLLARAEDRTYRLGPRLLRLAASAVGDPLLRERARPALASLARDTGESAQLYVRSGDRRLCLDAVESSSELRTIVPVGTLLPLTAGSAGKVFLAFASEPDRKRLLADLRRFTSRTPSRAELLRQIETVRRRGWAQSMGERQAGVGSVSAPVLAPGGELVAVVSVSGPETRMRRGGPSGYAAAVVRAASEIERALLT
ncbi:MAG TPA: IclR family transcriptional regulator [Actinomycetota bacterium]|nr:IclR family transcriptional regulator [Actinomycetota bacterium]